jgi:H+/Cl- antiporter ClcA
VVFRRYATLLRRRAFLRRIKTRLIFWLGAIVVGLVTVAFAGLTDWASALFQSSEHRAPWLPFLLMPAVGVLCVWLMKTHFPDTEGGGIPHVMAELARRPGDNWAPLVSLKIAFGKLMLSVTTIGSGFSFGREAPSVQIGASIMVALERYFPRASHIQREHLLVVGGAAGIAAAFNTPLAGVVFALEELHRNISSRMNALLIAGIVLAGLVARFIVGNQSYFGEVLVSGSSPTTLRLVLLSALVTGVLGGLTARMLTAAASGWPGWFNTLRTRRPYLMVILLALLLAMLGWATGGLTYGSGFRETLNLLDGNTEYPWYFGPAKLVATILSAMSGLPGGIFGPSLAIGAGLGHDLYLLLGEDTSSGLLLALCMTGFLAAATQTPITAFVIVMELVDGYDLIISLMATAMIASGISRSISKPLYESLAETLLRRKREQQEKQAEEVPPR